MSEASHRATSEAQGWATLRWSDAGLVLLDQRELPAHERCLTCRDVETVAQAIESLVVRGAPAIGCTAAYGVALAAQRSRAQDVAALVRDVEAAAERLAVTRPTAVNLFWALDRMRRCLAAERAGGPDSLRAALLAEAHAIRAEDVAACRALGRHGLPLVPERARILTHCNAGALATAGYGTALGVVRAAVEAGRRVSVLADETRPFLQGARLTAWELAKDGIPVTVVTDGMPAHLMQRGEVDLVIVGADRVAANGDVANKIGTYGVALLARAHGIPFYVAAPCSTIDPDTPKGDAIPIEERGRDEVARLAGTELVPEGVPVRHPAFDVTPAELVTALVTERGVVREPGPDSIAALLHESCAPAADSDLP
ncbi:MAG: S-methyl-5-thioribose-1-phosphate isomerase [Myxococcota bacterium]